MRNRAGVLETYPIYLLQTNTLTGPGKSSSGNKNVYYLFLIIEKRHPLSLHLLWRLALGTISRSITTPLCRGRPEPTTSNQPSILVLVSGLVPVLVWLDHFCCLFQFQQVADQTSNLVGGFGSGLRICQK